jgi:hypothetical protein
MARFKGEQRMRALLAGIFALGFTVLPRAAQAKQRATDDASGAAATVTAPAHPEPAALDAAHQQLRELLAAQADELRAAREQIRQLQRRMEVLEGQLRPRNNSENARDFAAASAALEATAAAVTIAIAAPPPSADIQPSSEPATISAAANPPASAQTSSEQKSDSIELANGKIRIGTLLFADYAYYTKTGFGPQFVTQINPPGPGNNSYNAFEINRAYLNVYFSPTDAFTFRLTPELYRQIGSAPSTKIGATGAIASNTDQPLPFRLKYAFLDFNTLFAFSDTFKKTKLTIGMQQNPLIEWEERLYGYRFVNTVPWDFLGFSSALLGVDLHGPVEFNSKRYLDYSIGVFNNASYRQLEQSEKKQVAARLTYFPLGAKSDLDGLGFTGFYNFGYTNVTPDSGVNFPLYRVAALVHYTFKKNAYEIAGEFDAGRNAFTSSNFFSGAAPQDEFGLATTQYAGFDAMVKAIQNTNGTIQRGYIAFGHAQIPRSPFTVFATFHSFSPNTKVDKNPLDFNRVIAGISYKFSDRLRFAITSQNLLFRHSQFTFPASQLQLFSPALATANPNGIAKAVPNRIQAIFANTEFNF